MRQTQYSNHVEQRPLTAADQYGRQRTEFAGTMARHPAAPLVRGQRGQSLAAWDIRGTRGSR